MNHTNVEQGGDNATAKLRKARQLAGLIRGCDERLAKKPPPDETIEDAALRTANLIRVRSYALETLIALLLSR